LGDCMGNVLQKWGGGYLAQREGMNLTLLVQTLQL